MNFSRLVCVVYIGAGLFLLGSGLGSGLAYNSSRSFRLTSWPKARADCGTDSRYQQIPEAWIDANTDVSLANWWRNQSSNSSLVRDLSTQFGSAGVRSIDCGWNRPPLGSRLNCTTPACSDYPGQIWPYLVLNAAIHLNTVFNVASYGIWTMSNDSIFLYDRNSVVRYPADEVSFWFAAVLGSFFAGIAFNHSSEATRAIPGSLSFVHAGVQEVTRSLTFHEDVPASSVSSYVKRAGIKAYQNLEIWANKTFTGEVDSLGQSILNYTFGGSFISNKPPDSLQFEDFFKTQITSRSINAIWTKERYFVTFSRTRNSDIATGPPKARYYSEEEQGVYYVYSYVSDFNLTTNLDCLLERKITGSDIAKASARAWRQGGFEYTHELSLKRIMDSILSNGTLRPFEDNASWEGTWTLPVCDLGIHSEWNSPYGIRPDGNQKYYLPCCCGPDCQDTKAFVKASNLLGSQPYIHRCKEQLQGTEINFALIDYGFEYQEISRKRYLYLFGVISPFVMAGFGWVCYCHPMWLFWLLFWIIFPIPIALIFIGIFLGDVASYSHEVARKGTRALKDSLRVRV